MVQLGRLQKEAHGHSELQLLMPYITPLGTVSTEPIGLFTFQPGQASHHLTQGAIARISRDKPR